MREETFPTAKGWYRLGKLLIPLGQYSKAQQICEIMLDQKSDDTKQAKIYFTLGSIKSHQGEYAEAITFCEKSIEIFHKKCFSK